MILWEYLIAFALITQPEDSTFVPKEYNVVPVCRAIRELSIQFEIMDRRERTFSPTDDIWSKPVDYTTFVNEVCTLNNRYHYLLDAPLSNSFGSGLEDFDFGPILSFNIEYSLFLKEHRNLYLVTDPAVDEINEAINECEKLYNIYYKIKLATRSYNNIATRRRYLKQLREELGPEMFYSGTLPPYVPTWRFWIIE